MKHIYNKGILLTTAFVIGFILQACTTIGPAIPPEDPSTAEPAVPPVQIGLSIGLTLEDEEIEVSLREEIHELNTKVIESLKKADFDLFLSYFATGFMDENEIRLQLTDVFNQITEVAKDKDFVEFRDYYYKSTKETGQCTTFPDNKYDFGVSIDTVSSTQFISLMESPEAFHNFLLSNVYIEQDGAWKLLYCHLGSYKIAEKNAIHWYEEGLEYYKQGYLVPALFRLRFSNECLYPAPFLKYDDENEVVHLTEKVRDKVSGKYSFPITLSTVEGSPAIYHIEPKFVKNDIIPLIIYVTSHDLEDITALDVEAHAMSPVCQELFPGITEGTTHLVFWAYSEPPIDPSKIYRRYGTIVEVD